MPRIGPSLRWMLWSEMRTTTGHSAQLSALLRANAGTRFWTEADMRHYAGLVNEMLDRLRVRLLAPDGEPRRLSVKSSNCPSGRYALFRYLSREGGGSFCRRCLPDNILLCGPQ